jgi:hypothetical protein
MHNYESWSERKLIQTPNYWDNFIELSMKLEVEKWLANVREQQMQNYDYTDLITHTREKFASERYLYDEDDLTEEEFLIGFIPEVSPYSRYLYNTRTNQFYEKETILFTPTLHTWQIPAYFLFGAMNECPLPEEHCALWQYWQQKYGAEIIALDFSAIEAKVERLPATWEEALELAQQLHYYCPDNVNQSPYTIEAFAKYLQQSYYWHFWWD